MIRKLARCVALTAALSVCLGSTSTAFAQTGSISGTVVDSETGETLIGADVILEGTSIGSTTDLGGAYTILDVDPGTHSLVFSYIGFSSKMVTGVDTGRILSARLPGVRSRIWENRSGFLFYLATP